MSQEDARGLGKTTDFMRAVSILFLVMNVYFCYPFFHRLGCTNGMVDRILLNLQRDTGLFTHSLVTKSFCLMFLFFSAMGARGRRELEMSRRRIGCILIFGLSFPVGHPACHAAVRLCRHRGLHLPPDRRHVGRPPFRKPADG